MPTGKTLVARKTQSASESAYEALLHAILSMDLQPGDIVSEASIAEQLNLSRTPVREAVKRLEHEGLITVMPRKGSTVALLNHEEVQDGSELRAIIECRCLERAFRFGITNAENERLRALNVRLEEAWRSKKLSEWVQADVDFHDCIVSLGRSPWSTRSIQMINMQLQRARYWTSDKQKIEETLAEHEAILLAIASGDLAVATERLRAHILRLPERVVGGNFDLDGTFKRI